jgi:hypothetical protein
MSDEKETQMNGEDAVREIAKAVGGEIKEMGRLPDNSGFAVMSMPLPEKHWIYGKDIEGYEAPPMVFRMGAKEMLIVGENILSREQMAEKIREAGKYAVRSATMSGKEMDFDPDALLQNLVVGFLGYWTADGLSSDEWANPAKFRR